MKKIYHAPQTVVYSISGYHLLNGSGYVLDDTKDLDEDGMFTNKKRKDTPHPIWG